MAKQMVETAYADGLFSFEQLVWLVRLATPADDEHLAADAVGCTPAACAQRRDGVAVWNALKNDGRPLRTAMLGRSRSGTTSATITAGRLDGR